MPSVSMPQPVPWVKATTPSTLGKLAKAAGLLRLEKWSAMARAAVAVGVAGLFMETHPKPADAWSDGPNAVPLGKMKALLETLVQLDSVTKKTPFLEDDFS